jgi:FtsP/CotA-like multicopper oxidase with cupredoxin domain
VQEPAELRAGKGVLEVGLKFLSDVDRDGSRRYCYVSDAGLQSPTLRVAPGDLLSIHFQNDLPGDSSAVSTSMPMSMDAKSRMATRAAGADAACAGAMGGASTNLHFHGLAVPPVCHQDESIHTLVNPSQRLDYAIRIPATNPPGLYWYHPHPHGISEAQVQGGASGALIVEGIDAALPELASMPHRTFILRDQLLPPGTVNSADPALPSWDVSINYVPVRYPKYQPATILAAPKERQFWRFVNAAANTIFSLQILYDNAPQTMEVFAIDGVPVAGGPIAEDALLLPPGARAEFVVTTPAAGQEARLVTQKFDSGPAGDSAPARPLAKIVATEARRQDGAPQEEARETARAGRAAPVADLRSLKSARTRNLYFSQNGAGTEGGAGAATKFFLTVVGQPVKAFDMGAPPNIVARQGTVEDWNIQNMTPEDHIFHIHQIHFQVIAVNGVPVDDPVIRDTIRVPHQVGRTPISSMKLRMDFRSPEIAGIFVYHCHILGHEDKGMMGSIQVLPAQEAGAAASK